LWSIQKKNAQIRVHNAFARIKHRHGPCCKKNLCKFTHYRAVHTHAALAMKTPCGQVLERSFSLVLGVRCCFKIIPLTLLFSFSSFYLDMLRLHEPSSDLQKRDIHCISCIIYCNDDRTMCGCACRFVFQVLKNGSIFAPKSFRTHFKNLKI
jgi:hypothetical protein